MKVKAYREGDEDSSIYMEESNVSVWGYAVLVDACTEDILKDEIGAI